jgi:hypothetical protein
MNRPAIPNPSLGRNVIKPATQQFTSLRDALSQQRQQPQQPSIGQAINSLAQNNQQMLANPSQPLANQNFYTDKTNYGKPMPSLNDLLNKGTDQQTQQAPLNQANNPTSQNNPQPTTQPTTPMQAQANQQPQQAEAPAQDNAAIDQQIAALQAQIQQLQAQRK